MQNCSRSPTVGRVYRLQNDDDDDDRPGGRYMTSRRLLCCFVMPKQNVDRQPNELCEEREKYVDERRP